MSNIKVYIVGVDSQVSRMFYEQGYAITLMPENADVICLIGGADINPELYGETLGPMMRKSNLDARADERDKAAWEKFNKTKMTVGICRG